ncbi:MAG TPA: hypothetical protein PLO65_15480, partial [Caulobacter sp.]|nr:hypothetical protein [Caulobacter sp.]
VDPAGCGFTDPRLADPEQATLVLARTGLAGAPFNVGWLAHCAVRTGEGSAVRSRFWFGRPHVATRDGPVGAVVAATAGRLARISEGEARSILI